jgi:anti-repressor protein
MSHLITITEKLVGQKTIQAVSARELHEKLGVKKDYSSWFSQHTSEWRNGNDYSVFTLEGENLSGGRPASDATLSIQMAEHIAMMSGSKKLP